LQPVYFDLRSSTHSDDHASASFQRYSAITHLIALQDGDDNYIYRALNDVISTPSRVSNYLSTKVEKWLNKTVTKQFANKPSVRSLTGQLAD